jgi:outer membrane protein assembly factor BamD
MLSVDRDQTETEKAIEEFEFLLSRYPQSPYAGLALSRIKFCKKRIAEHEFIIGSYYLKNQNYQGAIDRFNFVMENYPLDIEKDKVLFHLSKAYLLSDNKTAAEKVFSSLSKQFPNSAYTREARILLGIATEKEKEESKKEKENKKFLIF